MTSAKDKKLMKFILDNPKLKKQMMELYHGASDSDNDDNEVEIVKKKKKKIITKGRGRKPVVLEEEEEDIIEEPHSDHDEVERIARAFGFHQRPPLEGPLQIHTTAPMMKTPKTFSTTLAITTFPRMTKMASLEAKEMAGVGAILAGRGRGGAKAGRGRGRPMFTLPVNYNE